MLLSIKDIAFYPGVTKYTMRIEFDKREKKEPMELVAARELSGKIHLPDGTHPLLGRMIKSHIANYIASMYRSDSDY